MKSRIRKTCRENHLGIDCYCYYRCCHFHDRHVRICLGLHDVKVTQESNRRMIKSKLLHFEGKDDIDIMVDEPEPIGDVETFRTNVVRD